MNYIAFCVIALLATVNVNAQVLVAKVNFGSCPKCQVPLSLLSPASNQIPTYLALPSDSRSDSVELEEAYGIRSKGIIVLYNDALYDFLPDKHQSTLFLLDATGHIVWKKSLLELNQGDVSAGNSLYLKSYAYKKKGTEINYIKYNKRFAFDLVLGKLSIYGYEDTSVYKMTEKDQQVAMKKSGQKQEEMTDEAKAFFALNKQYRPSFVSFYPLSTDEVFLMGRYYMAERKGENTTIIPQNALFYHKNRKAVEVYPISTKNLPEGYSFDPSNFIMPNRQTILMPFFIAQEMPFRKPAKFAGMFVLKNGIYEFQQQLGLELPDVYKTNFGYNLVSFRIADYPFLMMPFGTDIYDVQTSKAIRMPFLHRVDYGNITPQDLVERGNEAVPFRNVDLVYDNKRNLIYIVSQYQKKYYLCILEASTWKARQIIQLNRYIPSIDESDHIFVSREADALYTENKWGYVYGFPISIMR